jgi:hypothetical protein
MTRKLHPCARTNAALYGAAICDLGVERLHVRARWKNNRAENQPTLRFTTLSTSNAISCQLNRTGTPHRGDEHMARGLRRLRFHAPIPLRVVVSIT